MATILIVDDQPDNLYVLERLLKGQSHRVLQADRGSLALEMARRDQPDLILLDVMMPGMDGFEVVRRLRDDLATRAIPVILLTANAPDERLKIQGLNLGADEYLSQPINNSELLARVRALLRTKQVQDDLLAANVQLRALLDVIQKGASSLNLREVGQRLVDSAVQAAKVETGGIWLLRDGELECLAECDSDHKPLDLNTLPSIFSRVIEQREAVIGRPSELDGAMPTHTSHLATVVVLPLIHRDNVVGLLQLGATSERSWGEKDLSFLNALGAAAASAVENARLFEETDRQRRRLEMLDNEKDEFISVITHELKNPLASIKGYAGLLARRARKDPTLAAATKSVEVIQQQVSRMTLLLDQLRDVSHLGINRFAIEPRLVDIAPLIEHVVTDAQTTTSEHTLQLTIVEPPIMAWADEFRIEQVLSNLVGNAIKYSPDGGQVEVTVTKSRLDQTPNRQPALPDGWAVITVRDHGIGIPTIERERLFERFFRAANAKGKVSGMGLGLYIAREIVQRHGGEMWVDSAEGAGSLFGIALPPEAPADADALASYDGASAVDVEL